MNKIYAITTHDKEPFKAAEAWKRNGLCAIGWINEGNLKNLNRNHLNQNMKLFLEIEKGDVILAYSTRNTIAYVGDVVDGQYIHDISNKVGHDYGYPNQLSVQWWQEPKHFKRMDLPPFFSSQLGKRGRTVVCLDLGNYGFAKALDVIKACANTNSASSELNEDMIKIGLHAFLDKHIDFLEQGLRIDEAEVQISPEDRPDFVGIDATNRTILIECKGTASASACDQLTRYGQTYGGKPRLLLVAFVIEEACKKQAKKEHIELIECSLTPRRIL